MIKVNKRQYERPAMRVVALQQRYHLLGMSGNYPLMLRAENYMNNYMAIIC